MRLAMKWKLKVDGTDCVLIRLVGNVLKNQRTLVFTLKQERIKGTGSLSDLIWQHCVWMRGEWAMNDVILPNVAVIPAKNEGRKAEKIIGVEIFFSLSLFHIMLSYAKWMLYP